MIYECSRWIYTIQRVPKEHQEDKGFLNQLLHPFTVEENQARQNATSSGHQFLFLQVNGSVF
jgi:hypothetical protein